MAIPVAFLYPYFRRDLKPILKVYSIVNWRTLVLLAERRDRLPTFKAHRRGFDLARGPRAVACNSGRSASTRAVWNSLSDRTPLFCFIFIPFSTRVVPLRDGRRFSGLHGRMDSKVPEAEVAGGKKAS